MTEARFDCAVIGAGIVGLAHAYWAMQAGLSVVVIDRDAAAVGASVRNFGFVTVTGQQVGQVWNRARRSRDVWAEIAPQAGIEIVHRGLYLAARRPEALACLEEFAAGPMGSGCRMLSQSELPSTFRDDLMGALFSPHELRVESRTAIPLLAAWLAARGVVFRRPCACLGIEPGRVMTGAGPIRADSIVVCPGTDIVTLFPEIMARHRVGLCKLHMMRLAVPGFALPGAVMSDLGLARYLGYAQCPSLPRLMARLEAEQGQHLADGVHLIAVQSADGTLVVGDSHHAVLASEPFQPESVDALILDELQRVLDLPQPIVIERWVGFYPTSAEAAFVEAPAPGIRLALVTSGTGASTAFGIAEETINDLLGRPKPAHAV
jgi:FAD dependent oxidoreductase TIGR03364